MTPRPRKEPPPDALERLRKAGQNRAHAEVEIKAAVLAASDAGGSVRVIAEVGQLSTATVRQWVKAHRGAD
ncbi:helix-turn-helix domain-containing protein [Curtobacterium flaccumfaciens pv. oortii]|nr:helix-turn-helix domain-containing protein [Curtobacterium flaccumfaciens pv. oortii]